MESKVTIRKNLCQYEEIKDKELAKRACGIVSLCIVLNHFGIQVSAEKLLEEGIAMDGLLDGVGWKHSAICALAKKYGVNSYRQDYTNASELELKGIEKMKKSISKDIPVIFSIKHKDREGSHIAVLTGYDKDHFYLSDPEVADDCPSVVTQEDFMDRWKRLVIFFEPN